jgi:hypothetical protein
MDFHYIWHEHCAALLSTNSINSAVVQTSEMDAMQWMQGAEIVYVCRA